MRLEQRVPWLALSVKRRNFGHALQSICRPYSSAAAEGESTLKDVAVIGGGITGLTSAFYLKRSRPEVNVTVYDASPRLGGWLESKHIECEGGKVIFEQGPRSLRVKTDTAVATLMLLKDLDLIQHTICVPDDSVAAKNRYIYYPDHLVKLPTKEDGILRALYSYFKEPLFKGFLGAMAREITIDKRPSHVRDESIHSFLSRRFSPQIADNAASAFLHGVYAGDVQQLSARSVFPALWDAEGKHGSVMQAFAENNFRGFGEPSPSADNVFKASLGRKMKQDATLADIAATQNSIALRGGLVSIIHTLEASLKEMGVNISKSDIVAIEAMEGSSNIKVGHFKSTVETTCTHVICTAPPHMAARTLGVLSDSSPLIPTLHDIPMVTVMVVNLYYRNPSLLPVRGFGYLIPRSVPFAQNPEYALGVVFDSYVVPGLDPALGTKVTVMLGGHWWNGWEDYPAEADAAVMAKNVLARHLGIADEPDVVYAVLQRNCIPQYTVGHEDRLKAIHSEVESAFGGRLRLAGCMVKGVGVNDCVFSAVKVVNNLLTNPDQGTGLEDV